MDSLTFKEIPIVAAHNAEENDVRNPTDNITTACNTKTIQSSINTDNATANSNTFASATEIIANNNETDLAAMFEDSKESSIQHKTDTTTNSRASCLLTTTATDTTLPIETAEIATTKATTTTPPPTGQSNQFVTPSKPENKSIQLHASASTTKKKRRNKFAKCLGGNNSNSNTNNNIGNCGSSSINVHDDGDHHDSSICLSNVLATNIKTSLSMTSLPPHEKHESRDGIKVKLTVERPYNSLKKNADRNLTNQLACMHSISMTQTSNANNKFNRNSWGSGHSCSSLHSSAATLGIGSGKDDLWAAIQTNYNYIMDTNLLDSCKEVRGEIDGIVNVLENPMETSLKLLDDNNRNVTCYEDPKELRKWLREMESKLENSPTLSEATMLTCAELEIHLNEHSVLYHEIVSHARVVSACIRAASEKEQQQQKQKQLQQQQQQQYQQQLQHDSYNTDASLIAEQTNSSLSSTDDTTNTNNTTTANTNTSAYSSLSLTASAATTTSGVVCSTATILSDHEISPNLAAAPTTTTSTPATPFASTCTSKKLDNNSLERLQKRYHLLYLKAFEVQLWLDGLLRKKSSSVENLTFEDLDSDIDESIDYSDDCLDGLNANENPDGATEDDLNDVASDLESDITHNSLSYNEEDLQQSNYNKHQQQQQQQQQRLQHICKKQKKQQLQKHQRQHQHQQQHCHSSDIDAKQTINVSSHHPQTSRDCIQTKIDCEDGDDYEDNIENEEEAEYGDDEDEIDSPNHKKELGYTKLLVTIDRSCGRSSAAAQHRNTATLTDFEADSESSDLESIQRCMRFSNQRSANKVHYTPMSYKFLTNSSTSLITGHNKRNTICGSVTSVNAANNNATSELESCEIDGMQTTAAQATTTDSQLTATLLNEHLLFKPQQQQKTQRHYQQQQQRVTLMAITKKNAMTTGSTTQSLGSTAATSTTSNSISLSHSNSYSVSGNNSDSMSVTSSNGISANDVANHQNNNNHNNHNNNNNNNSVTTKLLADKESNEQPHLQHHHQQHKMNGGGLAMKQKNIAIISPNSHKNFNNKHSHHPHHQHHHQSLNKNNSHNKSPTVLRKHHEHHHSSDISKFNHSNRKSKNCAIFYFKHLDTDNETNYSNSNCGDDVHDDCHTVPGICCDVVGGGGGGGAAAAAGSKANDHCYGDADGDDDDDNDCMVNDNTVVGGRLSSSTASSSHTSDLVKSADVSSDDEGWLYTSASSVTRNQQQHTFVGIESLNSNHISRGIAASNEVHCMDGGGIQSSTVSSSTAATSVAATVASAAVSSDDSDKENKEAKAACTTSLTQILLSTNQSFAANTTVIDRKRSSSSSGEINTNSDQLPSNGDNPPSGSSSSSSIISSSSNDRLTEATRTTSTKTITTQIHKHQAQHQLHFPQYRSEMELQISGNTNNRPQMMMRENILATTVNNKSTPATNMPQLVINHNNKNCANSSPALATNSPLHKHQNNANLATTIVAGNETYGNVEKENIRFYTRANICNISARTPNQGNDNNNHYHQHQQPQLLANINGSLASPLYGAQHLLHVNVGKRLPPRSPAKSTLSHTSTNTSTSTIAPTTKGKISHESIKQLVLEAEHLVRDEALKTPTKQKHSSNSNNNNSNNNSAGGGGNTVQISTTVKKREVLMPGPIKRVQDWLEHQPTTIPQMPKSSLNHHHTNDDHLRHLAMTNTSTAHSSTRTDDCEASGEASETDSIPQHCSDTSEVSDSIATCMQTSTNSYGNSTERIGGSAEPIVNAATSNQSLNVKVVKRQPNRRKSDRPWSVSCLSQLTTDANQVAAKVKTIGNVHSGLASHSISESALDSLSPGRPRACSSSAVTQVKSYDSKGSLKRRKTRKKKLSYTTNAKKSDTNSEDNNHHHQHHHHVFHNHHSLAQQEELTLTQPSVLLRQTCENMTPQQIQEITQALMQLQNTETAEQLQVAASLLQQHHLTAVLSGTTNESEEENNLMKPNFRVGSFTTAYMTNEARLGSLAALSTYMNDEDQKGEYNTTGTEDHHSSFSETAWDNYQEKYNSENYSEGFDSDAARKLLEFGDDYRNFIDSQSDCCSSLSAANNVDSFSPPRMDSLQQNESKIITQDTIVSSVDHARRRRALELEYERRRKNLEIRRKSCQESLEYHNPKSPPAALSSSTQALTPKNSDRFNFQHKTETATRKLEFGMSHSAQSLRRTSESDTSQRRRKADERRRSSRNLEKCIKLIPATSSSSGDDSDDEKEIRNLLQQSHNRLEDTKSLKIRCHLLRPEDYTEIITTCRDNINCLQSVLKGPTSSVLSSQCVAQSKDLLAAWEDLLAWSDNAAAARKMQEDMIILKHALNRLGNKSSFELLDTEPSIQIAIEALKNEKTQLQTYRTSMLKLNASVHSWLTRQERRLQNALVEQQLNEAVVKMNNELLEETEELQSEHHSTNTAAKQQPTATAAVAANKQSLQEQIIDTNSETTTMITVTDSNGNQLESHASTATNTVGTITNNGQQQLMHCGSSCSGSEKNWDLQTLITSETEFHKHLKDEVSDMYTAWDVADARINTQLEVLTSSLIAWRQLECGLSEFQLALGQDRGTLKGLEGALTTGQATPGELAQNVKLVAKLLSEKVNVSQEQLTAVQDYLDPNHILHIAKFTASNGSLSDSGISDGGTTSDGGLSERERRLGVLRRLAKQLESALAPGSEAMKSIAARMESAENELKSLQNTCRDLIVRTAASHQNKKQQQMQQEVAEQREEQNEENSMNKPITYQTNGQVKLNQTTANGKLKQLAKEEHPANGLYATQMSNKRRNKGHSKHTNAVAAADMSQSNALQMTSTAAADGDDGDDPSDDPSLGYDLDTSDDELTPSSKRGWGWRIAKIAVPMQLALVAVYCAANLMQPNCCDNLNNFSMSFTPQLRYIRGPPPI